MTISPLGPIQGYMYIDDTGHRWKIRVSQRLATAGNLPAVPKADPERIQPIGRSHKPRHIDLVDIEERPGMHKYRAKVIVNERDHSKFLGKVIDVGGRNMRCIRYVGEQRPAR